MKRLLLALPSLLVLSALHLPALAGVVKDHPGHWMGELKVPQGPTLKIGVELFTRADGSAWASVSSPDQGAYDIPLAGMKEQGDSAELNLGFADMHLQWMGDHFAAQWKQDGASTPIQLKQVASFPKKARPQDPAAPFPYTDEQLAIPSADGVTLGATLSVPAGVALPRVVILVHGSGPSTRHGEVEGHRTLAVLADHLARKGIAVLRYDKRGIARSTGDFANHTQSQLADDLSAVINALKARSQFGKLGLIGHSEGGMIAATAAARNPAGVDFLVSLGGVGLPGLEQMLLQDQLLAKDNGASPRDVARLLPYLRRFYGIVMKEADKDTRIAALKQLQKNLAARDRALIAKYKLNVGTLSLDTAAQPFLPVLLTADPRADWRAVRSPILVLNGSLDHQVPPENLAAIVASVRKGNNGRVESAVLPSLNHLFQTAKTGSESEYRVIEQTIAPVALERITRFALAQ